MDQLVLCGLLGFGSAESEAGSLQLADDERAALKRRVRRRKTAQALALRSRIILACSDGAPNQAVATELGVSRDTVAKWRSRFGKSSWKG